MSTLRFASQTKNIKNKPVINEDSKDALLRKFQEQVRELRDQLASEEEPNGKDVVDSGWYTVFLVWFIKSNCCIFII